MSWLSEAGAAAAMLLPVAIYGYFVRRVRNVVAQRHPGASIVIDRLTRPRPNGTRWTRQMHRYRLLADPIVDRQIRILKMVEVILLCGVVGAISLILLNGGP